MNTDANNFDDFLLANITGWVAIYDNAKSKEKNFWNTNLKLFLIELFNSNTAAAFILYTRMHDELMTQELNFTEHIT